MDVLILDVERVEVAGPFGLRGEDELRAERRPETVERRGKIRCTNAGSERLGQQLTPFVAELGMALMRSLLAG